LITEEDFCVVERKNVSHSEPQRLDQWVLTCGLWYSSGPCDKFMGP